MLNNELKTKIDSHEIISFDIFDTLLLRPFLKPQDVFRYLELYSHEKSFSIKRIVGEKKAFLNLKNSDKEDVSYDEIWENIDSELHYLKEVELNFEKQTLQANPEMIEIYNYALAQGKKIIIVSDMYLDKTFLAEILNSKGFTNYYKLYVSNTYRKTKRSGSLYKLILEELQISPDKILHIGDNPQSDIEMAQTFGINTIHYICPTEKFMRTHAYIPTLKNIDSSFLGLSIIKQLKQQEISSYWYNLGYNLGGILIYTFIKELLKVCKERNIKNILFVARDSWILNEAFNIINKDNSIKSYYIYASRILKNKYLKGNIVNKEYVNYLQSLNIQDNKIIIADTCAETFSAQTLIQAALPQKTCIGVYFTTKLNYKFNLVNLSNADFPTEFPCLLLEILCSSLELPIEQIKNNKPIYRETSSDEDIAHRIRFKEIMQGELEFIKDYINMFRNFETNQTISEVFNYISIWWKNKSMEDEKYLKSICFPTDIEQKEYSSLVTNKMSIFDKLRNTHKKHSLEKNNV